jgi:hypothetical protein
MRRRDFIAGIGIAGIGGVAIGGAAAWTYAARARGGVRALMSRILHMQAENAAHKISQFIQEIESQVGWTLQLPLTDATLDQHRFDGMRLLHQSAAITDVVKIDSTGKERLRLNRGQATLIPNDQDYSQDPRFTMAMANKVYFGPLDLRRGPSMTLALAGTHRDSGVTIVEVGFQLVWDVVTRMKVGEREQAYVIDPQGRLIAHSDISLVLRNADITQLAQVRAANPFKWAWTSSAVTCSPLTPRWHRSAGLCSWSCQSKRPPRSRNDERHCAECFRMTIN